MGCICKKADNKDQTVKFDNQDPNPDAPLVVEKPDQTKDVIKTDHNVVLL